MDDLEEMYPAASAACKADPARLEKARRATVELQDGRPGYRALWRHFVTVTQVGVEREFSSLGVHFDLWNGESSVHDLIDPMLADLKARGLAEISEGALVVPVAQDSDKKPMPPLILVKSEGGVLYGTTDLATIIERVRDYDPDLILYVVDHRQHGHFEQVFRAAEKAGLAGHAALEHVGYGTMNGADGKPFKTRAGGAMKLFDLIAMATEEAGKRLDEQGIGADYDAAEAGRDCPQGRHRHHQIRRSLQSPHHGLHFRPGALLQIRRQDRTLSAICGGAHPVDPAQGGGAGACPGHAADPFTGRARPGVAAPVRW